MHEAVIGVILLNWNGYEDTAATLASLLSAAPRPTLVVVVDNGSHDMSAARLEAWGIANRVGTEVRTADEAHTFSESAWLRIILADSNRGFAGGNNVGLEHMARDTHATHFLLLNNDALVAPDYFERIGDALAAVPDAGIMGCTIYHYPETERVWFAGGYEDRLRGVALHLYEVPSGSTPFPTEWVTGCAMLISRALYASIGGLAECFYPIYCEDSDYSLRARAASASVMIAPSAHVFHKVGGTVGLGEVVPRVAYWQIRHRVFYIRRNYSRAERVVALTYLATVKPIRAALYLLRGQREMASSVCRGVIDGLRDDAS